MGSKCRIVVFATSESDAAQACSAAFERISALNQSLSDYSPASEASRVFAARPGVWHPISEDLSEAIGKSMHVAAATDGAFDPTLAPLTKLWRSAKSNGRLPPSDLVESARNRSGFTLIGHDPARERVRFPSAGMGLDFGGIGKGLAADEALAVLRDHGLSVALIDFGGDLRFGDAPPDQPEGWSVQIRDGIVGARTLRLANAAIATSGDTERSVVIDGVMYSHILDPRTGLGLRRRVAATVIADQGWLADALASAACVLGPEGVPRLEQQFPGVQIWVSVGE